MTVKYPAPASAPGDALGLATPAGEETVFFDGFIEHPLPAARALLVVAQVAASRFHEPASMTAARIRAADPVVTAESAGLRFESFSQCGGVHARLDLTDDGLDVRTVRAGTTNVDFNEPTQTMLSRLLRHEPLRVTVGREDVALATLDGTAVERSVPLPARWVKGFGEVQIAMSKGRLLLELDRPRAQRFVNGLPGGRGVLWAEPAANGLRLGASRRPGGVCLAGPSRLRVLQPLARFATGLRAYGDPLAGDESAVSWELGIPGGRLTVTLSPEPERGFSGEGAALLDLVDADAGHDAAALDSAFAARTRFTLEDAAALDGIGPRRAAAALSWLGLFGHLGFDTYEQAYFWRHLPYPDDVLGAEPSRLADARALADSGAVTGPRDDTWRVVSRGAEHWVARGVGRVSCTCPWGARHAGSRGPCKHVLAVALVTRSRRSPPAEPPRGRSASRAPAA